MSTSSSDTETWEDWKEVSHAEETMASSINAAGLDQTLQDLVNLFKQGLVKAEAIAHIALTCFDIDVTVGGSLSVDIGVSQLSPVTGNITGELHGDLSVSLNSVLGDSLCRGGIKRAKEIDPSLEYWLPDEENQYATAVAPLVASNNIQNAILASGFKGIAAGLNGIQYSITASGELIGERLYELTSVMAAPRYTDTATTGNSRGGALTTTTEQYEEISVSNEEAFMSSEAWSTETTVDSAHAADLWFTYRVRNVGTEYAREIANLAFNIFIGNNPNPAYTYFVAPDLGGAGKFQNFMPGQENIYTSRRIPLSLEQIKAIDLGAPIRVVMADMSYGIDELFYQDAISAGMVIALDDGVDDGNERLDRYLIPTWGNENVLDVVVRYFPSQTDAAGNMVALWTPEYQTTVPSWCNEARQMGSVVWCKHPVTLSSWWDVYLSGLGNGSSPLQNIPTVQGSSVFFRFNKDSDSDGYIDNLEVELGTDRYDVNDFPDPEIIAGTNSHRNGATVTTTLSLLNTGLTDAFALDAVIIAPDDSITVTNSTIGGSARVPAQRQINVGSRILPPSYTEVSWPGTAKPMVGGYYSGEQNRIYNFTVQCAITNCAIGSGAWAIHWSDGDGASGTLNFGDGYASPMPLDVGSFGLQLAMISGHVSNGNTFTVEARAPRDVFQYTINREPYTEPIVVVSYNDPQGNHRIVTPLRLGAPNTSLAGYQGQMFDGAEVRIIGTGKFNPGNNTTSLLVNNTSGTTIANSRIIAEFYGADGNRVASVAQTVTIPAGPNIIPVSWNTASFSPAYDPQQDYILLVFWTNYQNTIIDTDGRPISNLRVDPQPDLTTAAGDEVWDFGSAAQGTIMQRQFALANVGYMDLLTYLSSQPGITVSGPGQSQLLPADLAFYTISVNTDLQPVGPFERTISVRTSDVDSSQRTIIIRGTIVAFNQ
jgi:hypothetical protein